MKELPIIKGQEALKAFLGIFDNCYLEWREHNKIKRLFQIRDNLPGTLYLVERPPLAKEFFEVWDIVRITDLPDELTAYVYDKSHLLGKDLTYKNIWAGLHLTEDRDTCFISTSNSEGHWHLCQVLETYKIYPNEAPD